MTWVHPLAADLVRYRVSGNAHSLPNFWTLCARCEQIYASGDDESAVETMKASDGWLWQTDEDVDDLIRQSLAVFRRADKGSRRLVD